MSLSPTPRWCWSFFYSRHTAWNWNSGFKNAFKCREIEVVLIQMSGIFPHLQTVLLPWLSSYHHWLLLFLDSSCARSHWILNLFSSNLSWKPSDISSLLMGGNNQNSNLCHFPSFFFPSSELFNIWQSAFGAFQWVALQSIYRIKSSIQLVETACQEIL